MTFVSIRYKNLEYIDESISTMKYYSINTIKEKLSKPNFDSKTHCNVIASYSYWLIG